MSGHSKWHSIKHKKAIIDSKRSQVFTKLGRELMVASRLEGDDPKTNSRLRLAIEKAKNSNMPLSNIERAIKKGIGKLEKNNYQTILYEGYGPEKIPLLINTLTDNKNRTVSELRLIFNKHNCNLGSSGSVLWMFKKYFKIIFEIEKTDSEEKILEFFINYKIEEIIFRNPKIFIYGDVENFDTIRSVIQKKKNLILSSEILYLPNDTMVLEGNALESFINFINVLETHIDIQSIYTSLDTF